MNRHTEIVKQTARWSATLLPGVCLLLGCADNVIKGAVDEKNGADEVIREVNEAIRGHAAARAPVIYRRHDETSVTAASSRRSGARSPSHDRTSQPVFSITPVKTAGQTIRGEDGAEMVLIPATDFLLGTGVAPADKSGPPPGGGPRSPGDILAARAAPGWSHADERPAHRVKLRSFAIDRFEVTNGRYREFLDWIAETGDHHLCHPDEPDPKDHTPRYWRVYNPLLANPAYAATAPFRPDTFLAAEKPVVGVDWYDAYAYAAWAGKRLPTEAEWELAARGRDGRRWPWGNQWQWGRANTGGEKKGADVPAGGYEKDGFIYSAPVGSYPDGRSPYGCDDMAGNVSEWCEDWYRPDAYHLAAGGTPAGPRPGRWKAVRGGDSRNAPSSVRCAKRFYHEPEFRTFTLGFRCAKDTP